MVRKHYRDAVGGMPVVPVDDSEYGYLCQPCIIGKPQQDSADKMGRKVYSIRDGSRMSMKCGDRPSCNNRPKPEWEKESGTKYGFRIVRERAARAYYQRIFDRFANRATSSSQEIHAETYSLKSGKETQQPLDGFNFHHYLHIDMVETIGIGDNKHVCITAHELCQIGQTEY
jgi:hypothetical protein